MSTDIEALAAHASSVALTLHFSDVDVEVTPDSVIFRNPEKLRTDDDGMLTSFSRDNFEDIMAACRIMPVDA